MKRKQWLIFFEMLFCILPVFGIDTGPLYGKNLYLPYLIHYNFPSLPARTGEQYDLRYHFSTYVVQDIHYVENSAFPESGVRTYDKQNIHRDYESTVGELGFSFNPLREIQAGMDIRLIAYYNGFLDPLVEGFHRTFGFLNGGREFFLQNQLYINMPNDNGIRFFLNEEVVSFGDIDLWAKWTFFEIPRISLAFLGAFKIPSGSLKALSGSGYPDMGLGILSDIRVWRFLTLYAQAGGVLPFNMKSNPMFNGLVGVEIHPWHVFSLNLQMNIKTSPLSGNAYYSRPQTNLLVGFTVRTPPGSRQDFSWQFYLEEDPFTHQGADITFNLMFSHTLHHVTLRKAPAASLPVTTPPPPQQ
ncbi:hypothetical protein AGMMS49942_22490 [Spirochaetia bacterium]|nr:hypothetical protein AGMMS49942_22490 [Spirochaetia bacterium]